MDEIWELAFVRAIDEVTCLLTFLWVDTIRVNMFGRAHRMTWLREIVENSWAILFR